MGQPSVLPSGRPTALLSAECNDGAVDKKAGRGMGPRHRHIAPRLLVTGPRLLSTFPRLLSTGPRLLSADSRSLCTAPRGAVHALGARLGHEAVVAASRSFSEPALAS